MNNSNETYLFIASSVSRSSIARIGAVLEPMKGLQSHNDLQRQFKSSRGGATQLRRSTPRESNRVGGQRMEVIAYSQK